MKSDIEIVREVKSGNHKAFAELVRRHQRALLGMCLRFSRDLDAAEDTVQDAFLKAFRKIHTFEERSAFKSWLFQIAINTARNKLRSLKREVETIDNVDISVGCEAESDLVKEDIRNKILDAIETLPYKQKATLKLRIFEDLSFKEIAKIMDCPYNTAKANYRHGLMKIREMFESNNVLKAWVQAEGTKEVNIKRNFVEAEQ